MDENEIGPLRPPNNDSNNSEDDIGPARPPSVESNESESEIGPSRPPMAESEDIGPARPPTNESEDVGPARPPMNEAENDIGPSRPPTNESEDVGPARPPMNESEDIGPSRPPMNESESDVGPSRPQMNESEDVGPKPPAALAKKKSSKRKRKRVLEFEEAYLDALPSGEMYERSYMHPDNMTALCYCPKTDFLATGSQDGNIMFWKKMPYGIDFAKHYIAHTGCVTDLATDRNGSILCSAADDCALKFYDVVNYDMVSMIDLPFSPTKLCWYNTKNLDKQVVVADAGSGKLRTYSLETGTEPLYEVDLHKEPVIGMVSVNHLGFIISVDLSGAIEYWNTKDQKFPNSVKFQMKSQTDLYKLIIDKQTPTSITVSNNGLKFAITTKQQQVYVFSTLSGKLSRKYDLSIEFFQKRMAKGALDIDEVDFGRRLALERTIDKQSRVPPSNCLFDESGHFLIVSTMLGIQYINTYTNKFSCILGQVETSERFTSLVLFQGMPKISSQVVQHKKRKVAARAADDSAVEAQKIDPTIFALSANKPRVFLFTRREPDDEDEEPRDVFNVKPSVNQIAFNLSSKHHIMGRKAVIHTTLGDIHLKLFPEECPKTVENFCTHARNGYYDRLIFHRVVKGFVIQAGCPIGDGTGGESIWGGEFEDEIHKSLKHDRPFTLSMANCGPNTNGSQFFITTAPCPGLDGKHTVFGRVTRGMDTAIAIENLPVAKSEKPLTPPKIVNIDVLDA
eukprot:TRINITY_DN686_c0_g1_i1.p1 TRINITY_DN686_c0_g1~~TRINITY_DN686_c0_g1_i1.p1  ORF type:complete len:765 (-),score=221.78 TRINITY_DN686_c0_g1_i1:124-2334(-)